MVPFIPQFKVFATLMEKALKSLFSLAILGVICLFLFSTCNRPQPSTALINDSVSETVSEAAKKAINLVTIQDA